MSVDPHGMMTRWIDGTDVPMLGDDAGTRADFITGLDEVISTDAASVVVLRVNLDRFGRIRQSFGVEIADEVLATVDDRIHRIVGHDRAVLHYGEGSYAVALRVAETDEDALEDLAMAVVEQVSAPMDVDSGLRIAVGCNVGIASAARFDTVDADALVGAADIAVERADAIGSRRVTVYQRAIDEERGQMPTLYRDMLAAMEAGQFQPTYQPIVHLPDRMIYGAEALVRWVHPEHGVLPPAAFIEEAERSGLIRSIDSAVRRQAMAACAAGHGSSDVTLSVNLSAIDLDAASLLDDIAATLEFTGLDPCRLIFEITETALAQHWSRSKRRIEGLKDLGVRLAIDDFGSGHMFLARLSSDLFDVLKIDRSLVVADDRDGRTTALLSGVTELAHRLGMTVTAEGVETPEHLDRVIAAGCDHAQGFLFGRPMPASEFSALLSRQQAL